MAGNNNTSHAIKFPIPNKLKSKETADSLEHWIHQFKVYVQRDPLLSPYLTLRWTPGAQNMGFVDPAGDLPAGTLSAAEKSENCKLFLAHVASFMEKGYYRKAIEQRTTSAESIWQLLRQIYNVETSAETLLDIGKMSYDKSETYLSFYHQLLYHVETNMAPANTTVDHVMTGINGDTLSVTLMDVTALIWLNKIDSRLYDRVKIDFAVRIKANERLSSMVPDIAKSLPGMLKSMDSNRRDAVYPIMDNVDDNSDDDDNVYTVNSIGNRQTPRFNNRKGPQNQGRRATRGRSPNPRPIFDQRKRATCDHCLWLRDTLMIKEVDPYHPTSSCSRAVRPSVRSIIERGLDSIPEDEDLSEDDSTQGLENKASTQITQLLQETEDVHRRSRPPEPTALDRQCESYHDTMVNIPLSDKDLEELKVRILTLQRTKSPKLEVTFRGEKTELLIDEGSEINAMDGAFSRKHEVRIKNSTKSATAAGNTDLNILGESEDEIVVDTKFQSTHLPINLGKVVIVENLGVNLILGEGGKAINGVTTNPRKRTINLINNGKVYSKPYLEIGSTSPNICRIMSGPTTVYPEDSITLDIPTNLQNCTIAVTPRGRFNDFFKAKFGTYKNSVQLKNKSPFPVNLRNYAHLADFRPTQEMEIPEHTHNNTFLLHSHEIDDFKFKPTVQEPSPPDIDSIETDPDNMMTPAMKNKFLSVNKKYKDIFTVTPGRYNGHFGDCDTSLQFVTKPVQTRKVVMPTYNQDMKTKMGDKMDELRKQGILARAEEIGVSIEFISPSLLVPKPGEENAWRLVTDFTGLNKFIKRDVSTSPTIQEARTALSSKRYFVELDLTSYFFQGGVRRQDCAFLGVMHPFDGPLVYTASPQGLKNSSEHSYNRLGLIFGDMIREGRMTRMADGLFPLGQCHEELLLNYIEVLDRIQRAGMTLKPSKTRIAPASSTIFGWNLSNGMWTPQSHVISSLTRATAPTTVKMMRSFTGAVKQLSESIKNYANLLHPLEKVVGSKASNERIIWNEDLETAFNKVKLAVSKPEGIHVPRRSDRLITSSDFSKHHQSIGGMLTIVRNEDGKERRLLGGHYSSRVEGRCKSWYPCDGEAFAMKMVLEHYSHYIRDSREETVHLTDSLPVVMAHKRAIMGRFSTSPKIATLLTTMSSLPVRVEHRPGSHMVLSDHASRHPPDTCLGKCDICVFINQEADNTDNCAVFSLRDENANNFPGDNDNFFNQPGNTPYLQLRTWKNEQKNCPVHNKLIHLIQTGQEPEVRRTGGIYTTLKHLHGLYLKNNLKIHSSGVVMVRSKEGYYSGFSISVPEHIFHGLSFMLHARLGHPKRTQLTRFMARYFYVPGMTNVIDQITSSCLHCLSTAKLPKPLIEQSTSIPAGPGTSFAADVLERNGQAIYVSKDTFNQFVSTYIAEDQTAPKLRDAIITTVAPFIGMAGATLRLDSAPAFRSLELNQEKDPELKILKLKIETSRPLNKNGNPHGESTIAELKRELLNLVAKDDILTPSILAIATKRLNLRVRSNGKSAVEMLTSKDLMTGETFTQLNREIEEEITSRRREQQKHDTTTKAKTRAKIPFVEYSPGDIVMLRETSNLDQKRETYVVLEDDGNLVEIRKMEKQLRLKTYKVKREQLLKVFSNPQPNKHDEDTTEKYKKDADHKQNTATNNKNPCRPKRQAALKSRLKTHRMAKDKITSIKKKNKSDLQEEVHKYVEHVFSYTLPGADQEQLEQHPQHAEAPHRDMQAVNQNVRDYGTDSSQVTNEPDSDHNLAFMEPVRSTSSSSSSSPSDSQPLQWDSSPDLVNLRDPSAPHFLFSQNSDNDEVFNQNPPESPQPDIRQEDINLSPISPYRRVTRSILRSGTLSLFSDSSTPDSLFERNNPLRRPCVKVAFTDNADRIGDRLSAQAQLGYTRQLTYSAPSSPTI